MNIHVKALIIAINEHMQDVTSDVLLLFCYVYGTNCILFIWFWISMFIIACHVWPSGTSPVSWDLFLPDVSHVSCYLPHLREAGETRK